MNPTPETKPPRQSEKARKQATVSRPQGADHPYLKPAYGRSTLREDQLDHARALALRLAKDKTPGCFNAPLAQLEDMALAVAEARADGINPRTASKDEFALREWRAFCEVAGLEADLQSEWAQRFPERESLKLASWLLWRAQRAVPRARKGVAKPMSIYQNYLALRRVFRSRSVELTPPGVVRETLKGLIRRFVRHYGIEKLRAKRVEPVTPAMVAKVLAMTDEPGKTVNGMQWNLSDWTCFIVLAWMVINLSVGSRKGESTELQGDVDWNDWFTRAAVTYDLKGKIHMDPHESLLRAMCEGDFAMLAPKGSKCDQFGTCHGTEPIILPFHDDAMNAARWLRDIDLRRPVHGDKRRHMPLFAREDGKPFKDADFAKRIMGALEATLGSARAKLYSPHSWRVWIASSLRMCNASDARIQAMGRWLNRLKFTQGCRSRSTRYGSTSSWLCAGSTRRGRRASRRWTRPTQYCCGGRSYASEQAEKTAFEGGAAINQTNSRLGHRLSKRENASKSTGRKTESGSQPPSSAAPSKKPTAAGDSAPAAYYTTRLGCGEPAIRKTSSTPTASTTRYGDVRREHATRPTMRCL